MHNTRFAPVAFTTCLFALASFAVQARQVEVDFKNDITINGELFASADGQFVAGNGVTSGGALPFQMNVGSGAASYDFCFSTNGFVSFIASGGACGNSSTPAGNYMAAFSSALTNGGNTLFGSGRVDLTAPYSLADSSPAMRFIWSGTDSSSNSILAELMLISRGSGNFDMDFRYGSSLFGISGAPATGSQGFSLGANTRGPTSGPFSSNADYFFSFVDGRCTNCGASAVPEPSTLAMLGIALLGLFGFHSRRRAIL